MDLIILPFFQTSFLKSYSGRTSGMGIGEQSADLYSAVIHYEKGEVPPLIKGILTEDMQSHTDNHSPNETQPGRNERPLQS